MIVRLFSLTLAILSGLCAEQGPSHMIVMHRVYPDQRTAFHGALANQTGRLAHWRDDGLIGGFQVLASALVDEEGWETLLIAQTGSKGSELFKRLDQAGFAYSTTTVPADLVLRGGDAEQSPNVGAYLVLAWSCKAPLRGQVEEALRDSIKAAGLLGYRLFEPRFPAGRSWNSLLVLHYADWPAIERREMEPFKISIYDSCKEWPYVIAEPVATR